MPCSDHCVVVSLGKTLNANFLAGSLCGVKDSTGVCFTMAYTGKKIEKPNKKQVDMVLLVSSKVSLGNNCPMRNVNDVVSQVRRIYRRTN